MKDKKAQAASSEKQELFQKILNSSKIKKYPSKELKDAQKKMIDTYKALAKKNDMSYEKYLKSSMGMSKKAFENQAKVAAKNTVKQELVLFALAKQYNIKVSDKEYKEYLDKLLKDAGIHALSMKRLLVCRLKNMLIRTICTIPWCTKKVMEKVLKDSIAK